MVKHMSSRDARANFADLLGSVYYTHEAVIVEKKGKPVAVIISAAEYQAMQEAATHDWALIDDLRAQCLTRSRGSPRRCHCGTRGRAPHAAWCLIPTDPGLWSTRTSSSAA